MELVGRETRSILDRYNITNSQRKVAAVEKLTGAFDAKPSKKVAGIRQLAAKMAKKQRRQWRERVRIELTKRFLSRLAGFEDQSSHQARSAPAQDPRQI